jgi:putative ABC transport system permease protein
VLSLSRAVVIAGIGTALGTAAGFVPALAWIRGERGLATYRGFASYSSAGAPVQLRMVVPWLPVLVGLVGIPLVAALVAGAFSRSRLPSERVAE